MKYGCLVLIGTYHSYAFVSRGPARGGSRVACLNLKMSRVAVLSHFTSLSVVELKENCLSLSQFKFLH